jgi:hypothetical protein
MVALRRASIIMMANNRNAIANSIMTVAKMVPMSIATVIMKDPWWIIRDMIVPPVILIIPQLGFLSSIVMVDVFLNKFISTDYFLFEFCYVIYYVVASFIHINFVARYFMWALEEKCNNSLKYIEEEQKFD